MKILQTTLLFTLFGLVIGLGVAWMNYAFLSPSPGMAFEELTIAAHALLIGASLGLTFGAFIGFISSRSGQ